MGEHIKIISLMVVVMILVNQGLNVAHLQQTCLLMQLVSLQTKH
jgi:hypothetical protein